MTDDKNTLLGPGPSNNGAVPDSLVAEVAHRIRLRPDAMFDVDEPERLVPLLPVQELLFAIEEMGVMDSGDLLALTTPAQVQAFLDLSLWARDRVDPEEATDWISVLLDLEDEVFAEKLRGLDQELLSTLIRKYVQVYDPALQIVPEQEMAPYTTPDTFFEVLPKAPEPDPDTGEIDPGWEPESDPRFPMITRLLDKLYRVDPDYGRAIVMEAASSTTSELEELAYRWRSGRLADLGYEPYADALEILQFLDPGRLGDRFEKPDPAAPPRDPDDPVTLGGGLLEPHGATGAEPFLEACLESLDPEDLARITFGFTFLANRVAAATLTRPGDADQMAQVLSRCRQRLNLGLEYLTRRQPGRASAIFSKLPVSLVFRVGHSLTLGLGRLVATLGHAGKLSLASRGFTLLEGGWLELARGLSERFPRLTRAFDEEPAEGFRPILSMGDLLHATELLEDLGAQWPLCFVGLGFEPSWLTPEGLRGLRPEEPGAVRLGDLLRTAAARHLLGQDLEVIPLSQEEVHRVSHVLRSATREGGGTSALIKEIEAEVRQRLEGASITAPPRLERILRAWLTPLLSAPIEGLLLTRPSAAQPSNIP